MITLTVLPSKIGPELDWRGNPVVRCKPVPRCKPVARGNPVPRGKPEHKEPSVQSSQNLIEIKDLDPLGEGSNGKVFDLKNGFVVKVSKQNDAYLLYHEYQVANLLCDLRCISKYDMIDTILNGKNGKGLMMPKLYPLEKYLLHTSDITQDILLYILSEITKGVESMHKIGMVYRDLKLDNISFDGEELKLYDLGTVVENGTANGICYGTKGCLPPNVLHMIESDWTKYLNYKATNFLDVFALMITIIDILDMLICLRLEVKGKPCKILILKDLIDANLKYTEISLSDMFENINAGVKLAYGLLYPSDDLNMLSDHDPFFQYMDFLTSKSPEDWDNIETMGQLSDLATNMVIMTKDPSIFGCLEML